MVRPLSRRAMLAPLTLAVATLVACGGGDAASGGAAGDGGAVSLGSPEASFPQDFGAIQTALERSDGTVLVADPLGGALYSVDLGAGTREQIGQEGQGPEEYQQPDAVWALPGDSTLLVDLGNGRMVSLGPDLGFGPTGPLSAGDPRTGLTVAIPEAVDGNGDVYSRSMGGGMGVERPDSGAVLRITRGTLEIDTVAMFKLPEVTITESGSGNNRNVSMSLIPLSGQDAWGVAQDGSIVLARAGDYHVEWIGTDGSVTAGPPVEYETFAIGMDEKREWSRSQAETGGGISIGITVDNGVLSTSFGRGGGGGGQDEDEDLDQYAWPDAKPPFYGTRIIVDPQNRAWVRRHVDAGQPTTYDVFDRRGERVATYELPFRSRVVSFGPSGVYVASLDDFDLNYLHRYAMPM
jgi:hypothetical protein